MAHSKAQLAEVAARRAKLIKLRRACIPFDDPRILALGYSGPGDARKDLVRALQQNRDEEAAEVSVYRQQENERLDALFEAHWPDAIAGDQKAAELVLKFIDRRAKLNGLDMPVKTEVSGPDGGVIPLAGTLDELNSLIATAGQLGPASDFATPVKAEDDDSDG